MALVAAANACLLVLLVAALEAWSATKVDVLGGNLVQEYRLNHTWEPRGERLHTEWIALNPDFPEPYLHRYNDRGWIEEYDVSRAKPAGTFRIFYVGDSFTEGTAPMDESVPSLVEAELNRLAPPGGPRFEVINTGTSSYSPTIHYILTRYVLMEYDPDLIVVNVDMTDDFDDWKYSETLIRDARGDPWAAPPREVLQASYIDTGQGVVEATFWTRLELALLQHSYTYNLLKSRAVGRTASSAPPVPPNGDYPRWAWCNDRWDATTTARVSETLDLIQRLMRFGREEEVRLMYTSVPHFSQYASGAEGTGPPTCSARPHEAIEAVADANDVPYLNSFAALAGSVRGSPEGQFYYNGDIHFNPRGYEIWARAHLGFLLDPRNALLPDEFLASLDRSE